MCDVELEIIRAYEMYDNMKSRYRKLKKKVRKMQKAFAAIECAMLNRCSHHEEFIIGECELNRGNFEPEC